MFSGAKDYTADRIRDAQVRLEPFPHAVIDNIFPAEIYAKLQEHLPASSSYRRLVDMGRVKPKYSPDRLCLLPGELAALDAPTAQPGFWSSFVQTYCTQDFAVLWFELFQDAIAHRIERERNLASRTGSVSFNFEMMLMRDLVRYNLGPHKDSVKKAVSVLFYLPASGDRPSLGTSLYRANDPQADLQYGTHYQSSDFTLIETVPFLPNRAFAFPNTPASYHGVEPIADADTRRDLLLFDLKFVA